MANSSSVRFTLAEINIRDFRGMDSLALKLPNREPLYLVGANNAGKSTILEAIALALKGGGYHSFAPEPFDFRFVPEEGHAGEFHIYLTFEEDGGKLPAVQGVGSPVFVHGVHVRGRRTNKGLEHSHYLIGADGQAITFSQTTAVKGETKERFSGTGVGFRPVNARLDDIRDFVPELWSLKPTQVEQALYIWKTGPLRRLATLLSKRFLETKWNFEWKGQARSMPDGIRKAHEFLTQAVREFPFWKDDMKPKLEASLGQYIGNRTSFSLAPDLAAIEDWLVQQLTIGFAVEAGSPSTPLNRMGDGIQSLVRIAALDVISQYPELMRNDRVVILFEEPETHLHPHLRRKLRGTLSELAARGYQVFSTTHAPEFISFSERQRLVRLSRHSTGVAAHTPQPGDIRSDIKRQERLEQGRATLEIPFSRRVLMSEGKSDELAFRLAFKAMGFDADGCSLSIVRGDGAPGLPPLARLAQALGLPWFAVTDDDIAPDGTPNPKTAQARADLLALQKEADQMATMRGALEGALSLKKHGDSAEVYACLNGITEENLRTKYADFANLCDAIRAWCAS